MVLIPQIDVEKTRLAITDIASMSPSNKMYSILLQSIDLMMDDMVEARESLQGSSTAVDLILSQWDESFAQFGEREAWYSQTLLSTDDPDELKLRVGDPLLRGKYPKDTPVPPNWPDIETPWRLMNEIAQAAAIAKKPQPFLDELESRWKDNFARYWTTNSLRLSMHAKKLEEGTAPEPPPATEGEGISFSFTGDTASSYRNAARGAADNAKNAGFFFSRERWESYKKGAKNVGIGFAVGVVLTILIAVKVRL